MGSTTDNPHAGAWGNVPDDCHPKVKQLLGYWHSVHPGAGLPGRQHIDPTRFPNLLPNIRLIDVVGLPRRFRIRLTGDRIREHFGDYHVGQFLDDAFERFAERPSGIAFNKAAETRQPEWTQGVCELNPDKDFVAYERVVLPLAGDGKTVDALLVLALFDEPDVDGVESSLGADVIWRAEAAD